MKKRSDWDLSPAERVEARAAFGLLNGTGLTLLEAVRLALRKDGRTPTQTPLTTAVDRFLHRTLSLKRRAATFRWYEWRFAGMLSHWPDATMDAVTRPEVRAWVDSMVSVSASTRRSYLRAMHALYAWGQSCEPPLCRTNPAQGIRIETPNGGREVRVMHAPDVAALLDAAGEYRPAVALMVFAGIRPHEIAGRDKPPLCWEHIDRRQRIIRIPGTIAKSVKPRLVEGLEPSLWEWLGNVPENASGRVCPFRIGQVARLGRRVLGWWSEDVLRHTAATHLLAIWQNSERVSHVLGHEGKTALLHQRYRGIMTEAEARAIADLRPGQRLAASHRSTKA